jgi:hypothetical protein
LKHDPASQAPVELKSGPIAFALSYSLNGAQPQATADGQFQPPIPPEWVEKMKGLADSLVIPDGIIPYVWPDK